MNQHDLLIKNYEYTWWCISRTNWQIAKRKQIFKRRNKRRKKKLESTIRVLNKEIEELKKKNTTLNNKLTDVEVQNKSLLLQVETFEKIIKGRFYTIWNMQLYV